MSMTGDGKQQEARALTGQDVAECIHESEQRTGGRARWDMVADLLNSRVSRQATQPSTQTQCTCTFASAAGYPRMHFDTCPLFVSQTSNDSGEPGQSDHDRAVSFMDANYDSNTDCVDWLKANFADVRREASQAMAEKTAQVVEQHLRKASSPPMTMDWQRMIDAIRSLAGADPSEKKGNE